jgi:hypothetical protein
LIDQRLYGFVMVRQMSDLSVGDSPLDWYVKGEIALSDEFSGGEI